MIDSIASYGPTSGPTVPAPAVTPLLSAEQSRRRRLALGVKRLVDVAGAVSGLVVLAPLLVTIAVVVLIAEGQPILFAQQRVGLHGARFQLLKFRSMVRDAEQRYPEVAGSSDSLGACFKMENDPRVTRLGRVLRRTSLDELPQLWNVLLGQMSLVGPRPAPPREVDCYADWHRRRLTMKPGITGLWQVASRFDSHFDDRANLDLRYIDTWSLLHDLVILVRTVPAIVACTGR